MFLNSVYILYLGTFEVGPCWELDVIVGCYFLCYNRETISILEDGAMEARLPLRAGYKFL